MMTELDTRPPYPWFGAKRRIASVIWEAFGRVDNFVDPFLGTMSVLLGRPEQPDGWGVETVNDLDCFIANFWRAVKSDPEGVADHANWPVNETDLEARHYWLVSNGRKTLSYLAADPDAFDAKIAGWWVWGQCCWIGSGWCSGDGPWSVENGEWTTPALRNAGQGVNRKRPHLGNPGKGVNRKLPHLGDAGKGVNRQLPHLGDAGKGVNRKRPHLGNAGKGVNRQLPHLGNAGKGVNRQLPHLGDAGKAHLDHLIDYLSALSNRLRYVRVCCGDWTRVLTPSVAETHGITAVVLDPPYADEANRTRNIYAEDSGDVAHDVREWALAHGDDKRFRICLCGYEGEHDMPRSWRVHEWSATGGYSGFAEYEEQGKLNKHRERLWFSPHCKAPAQNVLFPASGLAMKNDGKL